MTEDRLMYLYAKVVERPLTQVERDEIFDYIQDLRDKLEKAKEANYD